MPSILITGSNRGLGLEWARQYGADGWRVFATCRVPAEADALQNLRTQYTNVTIHRLDVTSPDETRAIYWELSREPIDVLLNNAGVYLEKGASEFGCLRYDEWLRTFAVNTTGPMRVTEALIDNVVRSEKKLVVAVSSHMGSIADINYPGDFYYRSSKAALNAAMHGLAAELRMMGVGVLLLHPGGVKTRMGPPSGIAPDESVRGMREIIENFALARTGRFFKYDGTEMPW